MQTHQVSLSLSMATLKQNGLTTIFTAIVMATVYLIINQRTMINAVELTLPIDRNLPFVASSIWVYWAVLGLAFLVLLMIKNKEQFQWICTINLLSFTINSLVWFFYPVTYLRDQVTLANVETDRVTRAAYQLLTSIDNPVNCFPSGHVSMMVIIVGVSLHMEPKKRWWLFTTAILGIISVLTTKQHTLLDVLGGTASVIMAAFIAIVVNGLRNVYKKSIQLT